MNEELPKFDSEALMQKISELADGLAYISETDADIIPFAVGPARSVDAASVAKAQTGEQYVTELSLQEFFQRLTSVQAWHGEKERERARRFALLEHLLEENLREIKVFKVGRIRIDIYVAGLDKNGNLVGVKTKAVET